MEVVIIEVIGYLAGFCTVISLIPQIVQLWRKKSAKEISTSMYIIYALGMVLWLAYNVLKNTGMPLIIANLISLILAIVVLVMKYVWK
jgi:MtN3 and saliva related transmembrane protein